MKPGHSGPGNIIVRLSSQFPQFVVRYTFTEFTLIRSPASCSFLTRYWEVELWDNLFDKLLNVDGQATTTADITNLLDGLISSLTSYLAECPQRSIKLQELLRKQDNMLNNR